MRLLIFSAALLITFSLSAQNPNDALITFSGGAINMSSFDSRTAKTKGSVYLRERWNNGNILVESGSSENKTIEGYPLRLDLKNRQYEIRTKDGVRVLPINSVKEVSWLNSKGEYEHFKNAALFGADDFFGMFEIVSSGEVTLLRGVELTVQEGHYNPALDVGSIDNEYIPKERWFIVKDEQLKEIKTRKRKILKLFGDKADKVKDWAKSKKYRYKDENDLRAIFNYYNSL